MNTSVFQPLPQRRASEHSFRRRTSFYAHRVKENFTGRVAKRICSVFLALLLIVGVILLVLWLSLRPHRPRFYLTSLSFPSLTYGSAVSVNVSVRNPNRKIGIYYDADIAGTLTYNDRNVAVGHIDFPFYQEPKNTTNLAGQLQATALPSGDSVWGQIVAEAAGARGVFFRLKLTSVIRFRVRTWDTHHHRMHVSCDCGIGADGNLLSQYKDKKCVIYFA